MAELIYSKKKELILIYFIFILIKFIKIFILEINAVPQDLGVRWQLLNTNLLEKDLLRSLYNLHYQPPLWNLIYGIFIKIYGTEFNILSKIIHFFNILISFVSVYFFYLICNFFQLSKKKTLIIFFIFFIFSPSYLFYETITHYTHLTTLFFAQLVYFYLKFSEKKSFIYEILIYVTSLLLVYTWTAFSHPLFIFVIFAGYIIS
jgi:hypothetical protein